MGRVRRRRERREPAYEAMVNLMLVRLNRSETLEN